MAQSRVELRRFKTSDNRGNEVAVIAVKQTSLRRAASGRLIDASPPFTIFELPNGEPVNRREDGTYEVARTGQVLREVVG